MNNKEKTPLELYVHIPFCVKKCDYCDFLSGSGGREKQKAYVQALLKEIQSIPELPGREAATIFIGGGTPSVLDASDINRVLDALRDRFYISEKAEITMEANPGTLTREKLDIYRSAGISRLSIGLQSADDQELRTLGRIHTYEEFLESYYLAREAGFDNINIDLMSAIPGQTRENWRHNLKTVAELKPEHISAYSLIVEEGTPFANRELNLPDEDTEHQMYEDTAEILRGYGYCQYEISNYALEGCECRHNMGYWKRTEYLGLGLGAASLAGAGLWEQLTGNKSPGNREYRFSNTRDMQEYLQYSAVPGMVRKEISGLSDEECQEEFMFLGLRMTEGISEKEFQRCFGTDLDKVYGSILEKYRNMGFLEKKGSFWHFTRQGIHVSNCILADFIQD